MKTNTLFFLLLLVLSLCSCTNDSESDLIDSGDDINGGNPNSSINYTDDVSAIMQSACISCHSSPPVNGAPFALINFNQVNQRANNIFNRMSLQSGAPGAMPPSGRLPQSTIDEIEQWIQNGKPEN